MNRRTNLCERSLFGFISHSRVDPPVNRVELVNFCDLLLQTGKRPGVPHIARQSHTTRRWELTVDFKNGYNIEQLIFILRLAAAGGEEKIVIP